MKFSINSKEFLDALKVFYPSNCEDFIGSRRKVFAVIQSQEQSAVRNKTTRKRTRTQDYIRITMSGLSTSMSYRLPVDLIESGKMRVELEGLIGVLRAIDARDDVLIHSYDSEKEDHGYVTIQYNDEEYRLIDEIKNTHYICPRIENDFVNLVQMDLVDLRHALEEVLPFTGKDEVRFYLIGAYIEFKGSACNVVATDGHRIAKYRIEKFLMKEDKPVESFILRRDDMIYLIKVLDRIRKSDAAPTRIKIFRKNKKLCFEVEGLFRYVTNMIDGTFPNYRKVIPVDSPLTLEMDADVLREKIEKVLSIQQKTDRFNKHTSVMLYIEEDKRLRIEKPSDGNTPIGFKVRINFISCERNKDECGVEEFCMDTRYLIDALYFMRGYNVKISGKTTQNCFLFHNETGITIAGVMPKRKPQE